MKNTKYLKSMPKPVPIYPFIGLMILASVLGVFSDTVGMNNSDIYREYIFESGFMGLLLYWFYSNKNRATWTLTISITRLLLAGFFLLVTVSVFWTHNLGFFISKYLLYLGALVVFLLVLNLKQGQNQLIILTRALLFIAVYIAIIGLIQSVLGIDLFSQSYSPAANYVNKNAAAQVVTLLIPIAFFLLLTDEHKWLSKLYPYLIALILAYVFHTETRAVWVGVSLEILAIIGVLFWQRNTIKKMLKTKDFIYPPFRKIHITFAFLGFLLLINVSATDFTFWGGSALREIDSIVTDVTSYGQHSLHTKSERWLIWESVLVMVQQNPMLGTGLGSFFDNLISNPQDFVADNQLRVHNDLLEMVVELGLLGVVVFLAVMVSLLLNLIKIISKGQPEQKILYLFILIALMGNFINMQFSFPYQMPIPIMIFSVYLGLIIKTADGLITPLKTIHITWSKIHYYIVSGLLLLVFLGIFFINTVWLNAGIKVSENIANNRWTHSVENPLFCHKSMTKTLLSVYKLYFDSNNKNAIQVLDTFNNCIPNSWQYHYFKAIGFVKLEQYQQAIQSLERSIGYYPKKSYKHYSLLYRLYKKVGNHRKMHQLYQQIKQIDPNELVTQKKFLKQVVLMAIELNKEKEAHEWFALFVKNYGGVNQFSTRINNIFSQQLFKK